MDVLEAIHARRSHKSLAEPAPDDAQVRTMLEAAVAAPDHKLLRPWRFTILRGLDKDAFREVMVEGLRRREPGATPGQVDKTRTALDRAPLVIIVACRRVDDRLPFEELLAATAAAVQNLLLAATALGFGAIWRTGAPCGDPYVKAALGLDVDDVISAFVYLGTPTSEPEMTERTLDGVVTPWTASG